MKKYEYDTIPYAYYQFFIEKGTSQGVSPLLLVHPLSQLPTPISGCTNVSPVVSWQRGLHQPCLLWAPSMLVGLDWTRLGVCSPLTHLSIDDSQITDVENYHLHPSQPPCMT